MTRLLHAVGDTVWTRKMMFFVDATHPATGNEIETCFPRRHALKVVGVGEDTVDVELADGFVATLDNADVDEPLAVMTWDNEPV